MAGDHPSPSVALHSSRSLDRTVDRSDSRALPSLRALAAIGLFAAFAFFYGVALYPGVGGTINGGDSAKFQVLAYAQIMVHGPGYPLYLMMAALIRALALPIPGWWQIAFLLSAVPAAVATMFAFLIAERATGSIRFGVAAALLLGSAHLMGIQATEAEVYALNVAFVLAVVYLLLRFMEERRLSFFLAACAVYALSFGNHVMMVMLVPLFIALTVLYRHLILRPKPIALIVTFIALGASQYLYLAYLAHDPETMYSEYMPLPPSADELLQYIFGTYFGNLYGSGLDSWKTLRALGNTFHAAHPWLAIPLVVGGIALFLHRRAAFRDAAWRRIALVYAGALCFVPFVLWYGAYDIQAFHLPLLALSLIAATASLGWWLRRRPVLFRALDVLLIVIGIVRVGETGANLVDRQPAFADVVPSIKEAVARLPTGEDRPVLALEYGVHMAAMYHYFAGDLPRTPEYRLAWHMPTDIDRRAEIRGAVMPLSALSFVNMVHRRRPDFVCHMVGLGMTGRYELPAHGFQCTQERQLVENQGKATQQAEERAGERSETPPVLW